MGCSAPALRVGTLTLAVGTACGFSLHAVGVTKHRFSRSVRKPGRASRDDGSRWRGPEVTHGCHAERKNGSAASELRCRCAWLQHGRVLAPTEYKVVARLIRARKRAPL